LKEFSEMPIRLMWGKSLVGGTATGDVFEGIKAGPIPYARPRGYEPPAVGTSLELGGPWAFYRAFWPAHNLEHLANLYSPTLGLVQVGTRNTPLHVKGQP
jgi:hypothetical protein